jgi:capsular exopolysaccharide synthesis family protein
LWLLNRQKWKIAAFLLFSAVATAILLTVIRPLYEATAKLEVEHPGGNAVIGPEALPGTNPVSDMDQILTTRMQEIQSESILRPIVERYHLAAEEGQIGRSGGQAGPAALMLKHLQIRRPPNSYVIDISYRAHDPALAAAVSNAIAAAYVKRVTDLQTRSSVERADIMEQQAASLRAKMLRSETDLAAYEKTLGISDPEQRTSILTTRLNQLTSGLTAAQDERSRKEASEQAVENSTTIAAVQTTGQGESIARVQEKLNDAREKFAQIKMIYGSDHPEYRKAASEVDELSSQIEESQANVKARVASSYDQSLRHEKSIAALIDQTTAEINRLSGVRHRYDQLKRDAEGDAQLYSQMMLRVKEYEINGTYHEGQVRIIDHAVPPATAVFPKKSVLIGGAVLMSLLLSLLAAALIDRFSNTLAQPELAARALRTEVLGVLPELKKHAAESLLTPGWSLPQGSASLPITQYQEAIRIIRNTVLLNMTMPDTRSILFTSAEQGEGKSTTLLQFAKASAAQGKRILLIDADLRRPVLDKRLGLDSEPELGLAGVLDGAYGWKAAVIPVPSNPNLSLLPAGSIPERNAADLIGAGFSTVLRQAVRDYDLVLIDAPPVLGFPETLQISVTADAVVLVARASHTSGSEVAAAVSMLRRFRDNFLGIILNRANSRVNHRTYGAAYRSYSPSERPVQPKLLLPLNS